MSSNPKNIKLLIFIVLVVLSAILYYVLKPKKTRDELQWERALEYRDLQAAGDNEKAMRLYQEMMADAFKGKIQLAGTVVDAQGRPLNNVRMTATTIEFDFNPEYSKKTTQEQTVNGTFEYSCKDCIGATLVFEKGGYFNKKYDTDSVHDNREMEVIKLEEQVILEKRGEQMPGKRYRGTLTVSQKKTTVLPLSFGFGFISNVNTYTVEQLDKIAKNYKQEGEALYLEFKVKQEINSKTTEQSKSLHFTQPVEPILDFSQADGGVIPFQANNYHDQKIDFEMKQAPLEGYQTTWSIDVDYNGKQYFYCRISQHYCRGYIERVSIKQGAKGDSASINVSILLNPTKNDSNLRLY